MKMEDALKRVDRRISPFTGTFPVDRAALTCSGSDVPGLELVEIIRLTTEDTVERWEDGVPAGALLNGVVLRSFWLGYEFGKAER